MKATRASINTLVGMHPIMAYIFGLLVPDGYEIPFVFTIIILVKIIMGMFLLVRLSRVRKENVFATMFMSCVMFVMFCWMVSRVFYMVFDYFLTEFVPELYYIEPNIWFWKIGSLLSAIPVGVLLLVIDRKILQNKFKGIFAYITFAGALIQFFYPVSSSADFSLVSTIGAIAGVAGFLVPVLFLWIGAKTPGLRKVAWAIAIGTIIYTVGNSLPNDTFINLLMSFGLSRDMVYILSTSFKAAGLVLMTYGVLHFSTLKDILFFYFINPDQHDFHQAYVLRLVPVDLQFLDGIYRDVFHLDAS